PNATISAFVGQVLAGAYSVKFTATATSSDSCTGSAPFTVTAGGNISVTVPIVCTKNPGSSTTRGNATINGNVTVQDICPFLTEVVADPLQTDVGTSIDVSAKSNALGDFAWSTSGGGTFTAPTTLNATTEATQFNCTAAGTFTLTM